MKLSDYKDANATSIQSYAETLVEKCTETGLSYVCIFLDKKPETRGIHVLTNIDAQALPTALIRLAQEFREEPQGQKQIAPVTKSN